jgi:hypothetical protein
MFNGKRFFLAIMAPLLPILLFLLAASWGFVHFVGQPANVKGVLKDSGVYETIIPSALEQAQQTSTGVESLALSDQQVKEAATKVFTPQLVQQDSEKIIDSLYDWLNGKTTTPSFQIDLAPSKAALADNISQIVAQRAATLPKCTAANTPDTFDPLQAQCLPAGVTPQSAAAVAQAQVLSNQDFLGQTLITADSLKGEDSSKPAFSTQYKDLPKAYQRSKTAPWVLAGLTLLTAAGVILLSSNWQKGLRRVGIVFVSAGIAMIVFAWLLNRLLVTKVMPAVHFKNAVLQGDVRKLISSLGHSVTNNYRLFGVIYTCIGLAAVGGAIYLVKRAGEPVPATVASDKEPAAPAAESSKKTDSKHRPPKLVQ